MSFIYLKSSRYLKNNDGSAILQNSSELPYQFVNSFREPIRINPKSQIEIVSADLNVEPLHNISPQNDNDAFTFAFGSNANQFLQKLVKIPTGTYSNEELAEKIEAIADESNLLDSTKIYVGYNKTTGFNVYFDLVHFKDQEREDNTYIKLNSKMGFQENIGALEIGIGQNIDEEIVIDNKNTLEHPNTLTKNSVLQTFKVGGTTLNNNNKPSKLISNMITPSLRGIDNCVGTTTTIFKPVKHLVFSDNWQTPTNGVTFSTIIAATTTNNITIDSEGGGHNLSFKFTAGSTTYHSKFVLTKAQFDSYTLPSSLTHDNIPWGHLLIINTSNTAVNTTLASNYCTLMLDTNDYKWKLFNAGTSGLSQFEFFSTTTPSFVKTTGTITSLGNWGAGSMSLSRGETTIIGTNQIDQTNRFTRTRVYNDTNDNVVYSDYSVVISPTADGTDNYVQVNFGTQETGKVANDPDWLTLTNQTKHQELRDILPTITSDDNISITFSMNAWYCVDIWLSHDTNGDLNFDNFNRSVLIGTTDSDIIEPETLNLPMNFNEASFPIQPVIGVNNGYVKDEQQTLTFGIYSPKKIQTHSLAKLNAYMNTTWGGNQTIPVRQPKSTYSNYCRAWNLGQRDITLQPNGFSGINTNVVFEILRGEVLFESVESPPILMKLGMPSTEQDKDRITNAGFSNEPPSSGILDRAPFISRLNLHMGMPDVLIVPSSTSGDPQGPEDIMFESENDIIYNESQNFIVNFSNLGKIQGQNSATNSVSNIVGIIPGAELSSNGDSKHYQSPYPKPVRINAKTDELVNNFEVNITNDDGTPATSLKHPVNICCRLSEN